MQLQNICIVSSETSPKTELAEKVQPAAIDAVVPKNKLKVEEMRVKLLSYAGQGNQNPRIEALDSIGEPFVIIHDVHVITGIKSIILAAVAGSFTHLHEQFE